MKVVCNFLEASKVAQTSHKENIGLKDACLKLRYLSSEEYDRIVTPENMLEPSEISG